MSRSEFRIRSAARPDLPAILGIYEEAFPPEERRSYSGPDGLAAFMDAHPEDFHILVAEDGSGGVVAFFTYWTFAGIVYGEHFAVRADCRGAGLGSVMLRALLDLPGAGRLLIEVEHPDTETARRRIGFYERHGLRVRPEIEYVQPPYGEGLDPVPLLLMTYGDVPLDDGHIVSELRYRVYGAPCR